MSSLAQTLLKLASPGVPDTYQGTELWDDSLVDPDNRRPVDYELRRRLLAEVDQRSPEQLLARADGGLPKLAVTRRGLGGATPAAPLLPARARRRLPTAGGAGRRPPATSSGSSAATTPCRVVVLVPRLVLGLAARGGWGDTAVDLPEGCWTDELTGDTWRGGAGG